MPKQILVMFMGRVDPERLAAYSEFMYTSEYTKALRDEYHFVIMDQTAEEKCYILQAGEAVKPIEPMPKSIHKLNEALGIKTPLASGGIVSGPSFGNTDHKPEMKDPNEKASFFGYKIRRSTMQDLESLMLTGAHASFKASDDGEIFITHAFPRGL